MIEGVQHIRRNYEDHTGVAGETAKWIRKMSREVPRFQVIAVIPTMLTYFGTSPERYEVTEVDVVWGVE